MHARANSFLFQFQTFVLTDIHALRPSREAFSCHNRKCPPQCDSRHHPGSSDLCFGIIGWLTLFSFAQCWLDAAAPDWYYVSCILWGGMGWQDRKAAGEGLTVNARRIIKTCEWRWIITSQAHLDMHIVGNALGGCPCELQPSAASEVFSEFSWVCEHLDDQLESMELFSVFRFFLPDVQLWALW